MDRVGRCRDSGASLLEYLAVIVLVAAVVGGILLAAPGLAATMTSGIERAVCTVFGDVCDAEALGTESAADTDRDEQPEPSPSPGPPVETPPPPPDPYEQIRQETEDVLRETEIGREFLEYLEENPIPVRYEDGEGGYWNGRYIQVDGTWDPEMRAATLIHELTHDQMGRTQGDRPEPLDYDSLEEYQRAMADFEVQAILNEIQFYEELADARGEPSRDRYRSIYEQAMDDAYNDTYAEVYNQALDEQIYHYDPDTALAIAELAAERAAENAAENARYDALMDYFMSGQAVGSNSGKPYIEVWEERYDDRCGLLNHRCWW